MHQAGVPDGRGWKVLLAALGGAALVCVFAPAVRAQVATAPGAAPADLPKAEAVLDRFIEVTGGKAAYEKIRSRITHARIEVPGAGAQGTMVFYSQAPDKLYVEQDLGQMGKVQEGYDGKVAWQYHPMMGARLKQGPEKAATVRNAQFNSELHWRDNFAKVETVGIENVAGKPSYKLKLTPREGKPEFQFFDIQTGLLVKAEVTADTQMGEIVVEVFHEDYREVDGVKLAHKLTQKAAMQEAVVTVDKIEHNVDIPAERFSLPPEIRKLLPDDEKDKP